jgi:hypothetical protein
MVVRCTKRTLDLLGSKVTLSELSPTDDDWYLNLFWTDREKCLLLTHTGTLFSVFRAAVRVGDLRPIGTYLTAIIETELRAEGLPADTFRGLQPETWRLAKTASRSTLGHMTQMAFELQGIAAGAGGLDRCDIDDLNHWLRHSLRNRGGYVHPIDLIARRLATRPRPAALPPAKRESPTQTATPPT